MGVGLDRMDAHNLANTDSQAGIEAFSLQVKALSRLHELAMLLAGMSDPQPALQAILETLVDVHNADFGLLSVFDPVTGYFTPAASVGFGDAALAVLAHVARGRNEGASGTAFATKERVIIEDVETDTRSEKFCPIAHQVGFRAVHSTPILTRSDETLGTISVHFKDSRRPSDIEIQLADLCARHAADSMEAAKSRGALRESEARFARFMQHLPGLAWIKDEAGRYVFANAAAHKAFQVSPTGLYGKTDAEVFPQTTARQFHQNDQLALANEAGIQTVEMLQHEDGTVHYSLVNKFPIPVDKQSVLIGGMAIDVTDRKRAEESLRESEQRFRTLASHAPVGIFQSGPDGETVFVNEEWAALTGLTLDEARGWGWIQALHPEDRERLVREWKEAVRQGVASKGEIRFMRPDGSVIWLQGNAVPLRNMDGKLTGYIGTTADITQRKTDEIALRESELRFRNMADHAPVMIWMTEADGSCSFLGKTWYEFTGRTPADSLGFDWIDAVHPDDRTPAREKFLSASESHKEFRHEYRLRGKTGQYHWVIDAALPRFDDNGAFLGYIGSVIDITDRKQVEEALREREAALKEADRRKDEFLALLAHELRNPLAPIRTGLELMRLAGDDPAIVDEVRVTMERQSQQMVRLIDDLLDVSRITRGTMELRKSRVELAAVVESAVETVRPMIDEMGHQLELQLPKHPIVVEADPTRLAQVVSNLLNNAAKYMPRGGRIDLVATRDQSTVTISVRDTGIGIPREMIDRIFDMFIQVDGSLERAQGGLGIGLTLVKRLVEMHGGSVEAKSDGVNRGSTFNVCLPIVVELLAEPPETGGDNPQPSGKRRILIVDDNENAATVLGMLLKALGNEVQTAFDGATAIELAERCRPDVVLLDIGMPKMNGYEAARRIREQPWGKNMVLAALTGWGQEDDKRRTREAGFDHHFVKPLDPAVLQKFLAECETNA
jgi:PAS domain S-box-containing protein